MGRDADFSWFRFVIPAGKVVRDDFPTGAHEFIPLNPGDSFPLHRQRSTWFLVWCRLHLTQYRSPHAVALKQPR